jgi:hypothetical protein
MIGGGGEVAAAPGTSTMNKSCIIKIITIDEAGQILHFSSAR